MCPTSKMRLPAGSPGVPECSGTAEDTGAGTVVVVGVKMDSRSKELLTWALVKAAHSGDRVIALHIIDPNADKTSLLSLVSTFDSVLAAYEGFCNLKQVDLKLKVCRGSPVRKVLTQEVKACAASTVVVGTSEVHHAMRSRISVAKYCAKSLQKNVSVICVDNGKIMFQRELSTSIDSKYGSLGAPESRFKKRKTLSKSPLSLPPQRALSSSSRGSESNLTALAPSKPQEIPVSRSGWTLLRGAFIRGSRGSEYALTKKSSVMQWIFKLPSRQSVSAIYPDEKQLSASNRDDCCSRLEEEKGAVVLYSSDPYSDAYNKIFMEELKNLSEKYSSNCQLFSYQELSLATNNFTPEHIIGKGGSSWVYKGCLPGGREIAVKHLKPSEDVLKHFVSEIEILNDFASQKHNIFIWVLL